MDGFVLAVLTAVLERGVGYRGDLYLVVTAYGASVFDFVAFGYVVYVYHIRWIRVEGLYVLDVRLAGDEFLERLVRAND